jgi:hypothetical protein
VEDSPVVLNVVWRGRNASCFKDHEKTREELKTRNTLVKSLFSWTLKYNIFQFSNFSEFVDFYSSFSM